MRYTVGVKWWNMKNDLVDAFTSTKSDFGWCIWFLLMRYCNKNFKNADFSYFVSARSEAWARSFCIPEVWEGHQTFRGVNWNILFPRTILSLETYFALIFDFFDDNFHEFQILAHIWSNKSIFYFVNAFSVKITKIYNKKV